ncbi:MAG: S8/S53 family peptidase [Myxococcales bacterium]|nr:S8/S53 family peptidase [Myxococcales bacterium]
MQIEGQRHQNQARIAMILTVSLCSIACGERVDGGPLRGSRAELEATCKGPALLTTPHVFENINRTVVIQTCNSVDGVSRFAVTDETGSTADFEELERLDALAFHNVNASMRGALRAALDSDSGREIKVQIWFRPDVIDDVPKEETVGEGLEAQEQAKRESKVFAKANDVLDRLGKIPGLELLSGTAGFSEYGPPVILARGSRNALDQAGMADEVWEIVPVEETWKPGTTNYFFTTNDVWLDYAGHDGTGQTVAILEFVRPDSSLNLPGWPSGSCAPDSGFGTSRLCHCPGGARGSHARQMMGIVRASSGALWFEGMADEVSTIAANTDGGCTTNGPDAFSSALNWATSNGARVISCSDQMGPDPLVDAFQSSRDRLYDYKASVSPYPFIAVIAGNANAGSKVMSRPRNGVSVGSAQENSGSDRNSVVMAAHSSDLNPNGATGFEVPHLVAIGSNVDSAGKALNSTDTGLTGTSVAAPQVAGVVAGLHEFNPTLKSWPEVVIPGLLASGDEDVDGTPLNLHDGVDDSDGAGLLNASLAAGVLGAGSKRDGNNPAAVQGHDFGSMWEVTTPTYTVYSEKWNASVAPGKVLRAAAFFQSRPTCPANPGCSSPGGFSGCTASQVCSANPFVIFSLQVYDGTTLVAASNSTSNNYQFVRVPNNGGGVKTYNIRLIPLNYSGLPGTTWGVAWAEADE